MESKLGKIVLEKEEPIVIISEDCDHLRGLKIVKSKDECRYSYDRFSYLKISSEEIVKFKYRGKKLDNPIVDYHSCISISNLEIREIGALTEEGYCKLLRNYNNHHACLGGTDRDYLSVRNDVHDQLIKMLIK